MRGLLKEGVVLRTCDLDDRRSMETACRELKTLCPGWDVLVLCPAQLDPVGRFEEADFDEWEASITTNFTSQMRIVHQMLPARAEGRDIGPCVLFYAGGGSNSAPVNYSAYTVSKIALTKMTELLQAEIEDTRFVIVGPGWVRTKIHDSTLRAEARAGENYQITLDKLERNEFSPMSDVLDCCDWLIDTPRSSVGGRNVSVVHDSWGSKVLENQLRQNPDMYKLRRYGNDWLLRETK